MAGTKRDTKRMKIGITACSTNTTTGALSAHSVTLPMWFRRHIQEAAQDLLLFCVAGWTQGESVLTSQDLHSSPTFCFYRIPLLEKLRGQKAATITPSALPPPPTQLTFSTRWVFELQPSFFLSPHPKRVKPCWVSYCLHQTALGDPKQGGKVQLHPSW